ncbi:hypothetical protein KC929_00935 [Patescibacteria group bacterium]|nr:hypothetical protein [Patescibacteria group bacterium]
MESKSWPQALEQEYVEVREQMSSSLGDNNVVIIDHKKVSGISASFVNDQKKKDLQKQMNLEKTAIEEYRMELEEKGIKPLAILPEYILKMMLRGLPFYTFKSIDEKGSVNADLSKTMSFNTEGLVLLVFLAYSAILSFTGVGLYKLEVGHPGLGITITALGVISLLSGLFLNTSALLDLTADERLDRRNIKILSYTSPLVAYIYKRSRILNQKHFQEHIKKMLWPNNIDEGEGMFSRAKVRLELPEAPASVQQKLGLCAINNIKTYVIAHEDGFGVNYQSFKTTLDVYNDPLICADKIVTEKIEVQTKKKFEEKKLFTLVAIIDQYGEIPATEELVAEIKKRFPSVPEQLGLQICPN